MTSTTGVNVTPPASTNATTGVPDFTSNFNTFLTLLTTQLQNQDPLSPVDTSQFTQQLVGFSQVEQQINTNSNLQQLIQLQTSNEAIAAAPLVGQTIQYNDATAPLAGGAAGFSYTLPSNAASADLLVEDASGNVVYSTSGNGNAGTHDFVWDGKTSAGAQMPDGGQYTLQVVAKDASNNPITTTVSAYGVVSGVSIDSGTANLNLSGVSVPLSELLAINPTINTSL
ncbi:MAG: flagellar hook assembly protein FlgD [Stellaceae bacterium]